MIPKSYWLVIFIVLAVIGIWAIYGR